MSPARLYPFPSRLENPRVNPMNIMGLGLRRSNGSGTNGDTSNQLPRNLAPITGPTLPSYSATAPPQLVIRASADWKVRSPYELSFRQGDFFHVIGGADGPGGDDWYTATNPLTKARGLVPKSYFQVLGRNERENRMVAGGGGGGAAGPSGSGGSGMANGNVVSPTLLSQSQFPPTSASPSRSNFNIPATTRNQHSSQPSSSSKTNSTPFTPPFIPMPPGGQASKSLYGVVQYDFRAERDDELDAKMGEPIIIIAHSNDEWWVAKPISRIGRPGLIPVSFVEVQDITTGKAVDRERVADMIKSGTVPKVEDWKAQTAAYNQNSIPLGRFDYGPPVSNAQPGAAADGSRTSQQYRQQQPPAQQSLQQVQPPQVQQQQQQPQDRNSIRGPQPVGRQVSSHYETSDGRLGLAPNYPPTHSSHSSPALTSGQANNNNSSPEIGRDRSSHGSQANGYSPTVDQIAEEDPRWKYGLVTEATVESFHKEDDSYWFHLRVSFGQTGFSFVLYRLYEDFYDFQISLMDYFPIEAGREPNPDTGEQRRILPMMPGPTDHEDDLVSAQRVQDLGVYLMALCGLPEYIKESELVYEFFKLKEGDVEVTTGVPLSAHPGGSIPASGSGSGSGSRGDGTEKWGSEVVDYLDKMNSRAGSGGSVQDGLVKGVAGMRVDDAQRGYPNTNSGPPTASSSASSGGRNQSSGSTVATNFSSTSSTSALPSSSAVPPPNPTGNLNAPFVKIKVLHRNTNDLIALRVPPRISFSALLDKVRDRLGDDVNNLRFQDEAELGKHVKGPAWNNGNGVIVAGGVRLINLYGDSELGVWVDRAEKLMLYAD